jgi:hypothetical protein
MRNKVRSRDRRRGGKVNGSSCLEVSLHLSAGVKGLLVLGKLGK